MIVSIVWTRGGKHAMVVNGYEQSDTEGGVYYIDPLDGQKYWKSWNDFISNLKWNWTETIYNTYHIEN